MKLNALIPLLLPLASQGFVGVQQSSRTSFGVNGSRSRSVQSHLFSSTNDEVAALRAAAAKARDEADRLAKELGKSTTKATSENGKSVRAESMSKTTLSQEEMLSKLSEVSFDGDSAIEGQSTAMESLREEGAVSLYKSASIRTYAVSIDMLTQRTGVSLESFGFGNDSGEMVSMDDFKNFSILVVGLSTVLGIASLAFLPENIGPTLCYMFALIPVAYVGLGSTAPAAIAGVIDTVKTTIGDGSDTEQITREDRILRHEAAHFLCGYLCGLPIVDYKLMDDSGIPRVEFAVGAGAGKKGYSREEVACLSITALSGMVGEIMAFDGKASYGAQNDLKELDMVFRKSDEFIGAKQQQDLTRWGALTAFNLLTQHKDKLEKVVEAFQNKKSVPECIAMIES